MSNMMDPINKFYQVYNENNLDLWNDAMAETYVGHVNTDTIPHRDIGKGFVGLLLTAFPDLHYTVEDLVTKARRSSAVGRPPERTPATSSACPPQTKA